MNRLAAAFLLVVQGLTSQEPGVPPPPPPATTADLVARYRALDAAKRADVVRNLERRVQREDDDTIQRIVARQKGRDAYPVPPRPQWFQPAEFAPVATPRTLVAADSQAHRTTTRGMRPSSCLSNLATSVVYDWQTASPVQGPTDLTDEQRFINLVNGYLPGADEAVAQVLATLHTDPQQQRLATYFEHLYADRVGRVFAGISLYDAWNSGTQLEMPDTDAIAFARQILDIRSFTAPLPVDRNRARLYEEMSAAFAAHREHRTLRLALAATFVAAAPPVDPAYQNLIPRCHWLWSRHGNDPQALARHLAQSRDALLKDVDAGMAKDAAPAAQRERDLLDLASYLRRLAEHEIARAND